LVAVNALSAAIASEKSEKNAQRASNPVSIAAMQTAYSKNSPELLDYSKNKQEQVKSLMKCMRIVCLC